MTGMTSPSDDERLSAYLDGELSESERADLEQLFEDREDYRDEIRELTAVREALRELPRESLPSSGFAQRVLQRAEQVMLTTSSESTIKSLASEESRRELASSPHRRWMWPLIVVAAAILLMLASPMGMNRRELASNDRSGADSEHGDPDPDPAKEAIAEMSREDIGSAPEESSADDRLVMDSSAASNLEESEFKEAQDDDSIMLRSEPEGSPFERGREASIAEASEPGANVALGVARIAAGRELRPEELNEQDAWVYWALANSVPQPLHAVARVQSKSDPGRGLQRACANNSIKCKDVTGEEDVMALAEQNRQNWIGLNPGSSAGTRKESSDAVRAVSRPNWTKQPFQNFYVEATPEKIQELVEEMREKNDLQVELIVNFSEEDRVNQSFGDEPLLQNQIKFIAENTNQPDRADIASRAATPPSGGTKGLAELESLRQFDGSQLVQQFGNRKQPPLPSMAKSGDVPAVRPRAWKMQLEQRKEDRGKQDEGNQDEENCRVLFCVTTDSRPVVVPVEPPATATDP